MKPGETAARLGVELTDEVPVPITDPTLGTSVPDRPTAVAPAHPLVTLGDSLTEGFQHAAILDAGWSWPSMLARALQIPLGLQRYDDAWGGQPYNLLRLTRQFNDHATHNLSVAYAQARGVAEHYGRADAAAPTPAGPIAENLAVWGWDLRDTLVRTADSERSAIGPLGFGPIPALPTSAWAAVRVLDTARRDGIALTALQAAQRLGEDPGGIGTLYVWLGANNILGTVIDLEVHPSGPGFDTLEGKQHMNAWTLEHFTVELGRVAEQVRHVQASRVVWGTVPHVTIPPITRALGQRLADNPHYFQWYARPWHTVDSFHPHVDKHLTGEQAWAIDRVIDGYNRAIVDVVRNARALGLDWRVADLCPVLDRLAPRRFADPGTAPSWFAEFPDPRPPALAELTAEFFGSDPWGRRTRGGLFGLDGVHPSTAGYAIVAQTFAEVLGAPTIDAGAALAADTLNANPPRNIDGLLAWLRGFDQAIDPVQWVLRPTHVLPL